MAYDGLDLGYIYDSARKRREDELRLRELQAESRHRKEKRQRDREYQEGIDRAYQESVDTRYPDQEGMSLDDREFGIEASYGHEGAGIRSGMQQPGKLNAGKYYGKAAEVAAKYDPQRVQEFQKMREYATQEGFREALSKLYMGDLRGAEEAYNAMGESRIKPGTLEFDKEKDLVTGELEDGSDFAMLGKHIAALAGVKPEEQEKPKDPKRYTVDGALVDENGNVLYKSDKARGIGGSGSESADMQFLQYAEKNLTSGDAKEAFRLLQEFRHDPKALIGRLFLARKKQAQENVESISDREIMDEIKVIVGLMDGEGPPAPTEEFPDDQGGGIEVPKYEPVPQAGGIRKAGEEPPVPGAMKAPDGKWYVKNGAGKYSLVE